MIFLSFELNIRILPLRFIAAKLLFCHLFKMQTKIEKCKLRPRKDPIQKQSKNPS